MKESLNALPSKQTETNQGELTSELNPTTIELNSFQLSSTHKSKPPEIHNKLKALQNAPTPNARQAIMRSIQRSYGNHYASQVAKGYGKTTQKAGLTEQTTLPPNTIQRQFGDLDDPLTWFVILILLGSGGVLAWYLFRTPQNQGNGTPLPQGVNTSTTPLLPSSLSNVAQTEEKAVISETKGTPVVSSVRKRNVKNLDKEEKKEEKPKKSGTPLPQRVNTSTTPLLSPSLGNVAQTQETELVSETKAKSLPSTLKETQEEENPITSQEETKEQGLPQEIISVANLEETTAPSSLVTLPSSPLPSNLEGVNMNNKNRRNLLKKLKELNNNDDKLLECLNGLQEAKDGSDFLKRLEELKNTYPQLVEQIKLALAEIKNPPALEKETEGKSKKASMELATEKEGSILIKEAQTSEKREGKLPAIDESNENVPEKKPRRVRKERRKLGGSEVAISNKSSSGLNINALAFKPAHIRRIEAFPLKLLDFNKAAMEFWQEVKLFDMGQLQLNELEDIVDLIEYFQGNITDSQNIWKDGQQVEQDCLKVLETSKEPNERLNASQTKSNAINMCEQATYINQNAQRIYQILINLNPLATDWFFLKLELISAGISDVEILTSLGNWFLIDKVCIKLMKLLLQNTSVLRQCEGYQKMLERFKDDTKTIFNLRANLPVVEVALDCLKKGWQIIFEVTPSGMEKHFDVDILVIRDTKYFAIQVKTATADTFDNQYVKAMAQLEDFTIKEKGKLIKVIYLKVSCNHKNFMQQYAKWIGLPSRYKEYLFVIACQEGEFLLQDPDTLLPWGGWLDKY